MSPKIALIQPQIDEDRVQFCENLLADAQSGRLRCVAVVAEQQNAGDFLSYINSDDFWRLRGSLEYAKARIFAMIDANTVNRT